MNIQLPTKVTQFAGRTSLVLRKHAPDILFGVGITGMAGAVVLAVRAGRQHDSVAQANAQRIRETEEWISVNNTTLEEEKQEIGKAYLLTWGEWVKLYGPAVGAFALSAASLTKGHTMSKERIASATAAYALLNRGYKAYRERVIEQLGPEKDNEFRYGKPEKAAYEAIDEVTGRSKKVKYPKYTETSEYAKFFDEYNINWRNEPSMNMYFLKTVQAYLNDRLKIYGHVFLNEAYDELGMDRTKEGQFVGWVLDSETGDGVIDLGLYSPANQAFQEGLDPACIIDPNVDGPIWDLL